jgi:hypothetical protein
MFNWEDEGVCVLSWVPPGGGIEVVPTERLFPAGSSPPPADGPVEEVPRGRLYALAPGLEGREPPVVERVEPDLAVPGALLEASGRGFAGDGVSDRVTISGLPAPVVSAGPTRIAFRVPEGARSGPLVIETLGLSSRPLELRVAGGGLRAAYFRLEGPVSRIPPLEGRAADLERIEPALDFSEPWSFRVPFEPRRFAARFSGALEAPLAGEYAFHLTSDDGARLYVDGRLVADNDGEHAPTTASGRIALDAGRHALRVEYFDQGGYAALKLGWTRPDGLSETPIPGEALRPEAP